MPRSRTGWIALILLTFLSTGAFARKRTVPSDLPVLIEGQVVRVADGDTLTVLDDALHTFRIRLLGIDAPERAQFYGKVAKQVLLDRVAHQRVRVLVQTRDRYGRIVGKVMLDNLDLDLEMIREGMAWHDAHYDRDLFPGDAEAYDRAEQDARNGHVGLWAYPDPVEPWVWRRTHR